MSRMSFYVWSAFVFRTSNMTRARGDWLTMFKQSFLLFSRDAEDGTPVENLDVVGFKYPYSSNRDWLTFQPKDHHFYPLPCSSNSKIPCAAEDKFTGFVIHKLLRWSSFHWVQTDSSAKDSRIQLTVEVVFFLYASLSRLKTLGFRESSLWKGFFWMVFISN